MSPDMEIIQSLQPTDDGAGDGKGDRCSHADENGHPIDDST
ncbi:hypothetical protein ACSLGF_06290 [Bacillus sp. A015]